MKEKEFISIIKNTLNSKYIGDDCAYLKDLGIVVTQDSLVEDIHFCREFITPYQLGYKSVMVNLSDIAASGAEPKYLTISLSLPADTDKNFVQEFYNGCKVACSNNVEIVGGDITGSDKIFISICAIGSCAGRNISSRKNAKTGQKIIISGLHGSSAAGLKLLLEGKKQPEKFIKAHLEPQAQLEFGSKIAQQKFCTSNPESYAMMDTSDGLLDALSTIAEESKVLLEVDFDKIPYDKDIEQFENWQDLILFGGEDYGIIATVPVDVQCGTVIGKVKQGSGVELKIDGKTVYYSKKDVENKIFNHFKS